MSKILKQSEQWPDRCGAFSFRHPDEEDHAYHLPPTEGHGEYNPWLRQHELTDAEETQYERSREDEDTGYNWGPPPNEDPGFAEDEFDDWPDPDHMRDYREDNKKHSAHPSIAKAKKAAEAMEQGFHEAAVNALDHGKHEWFYNRDPELGTTVPYGVGGDPEGAVSIEPPDTAGPNDARLLHRGETGLGYDVIVRRNPDGKGWDILKQLP